MKQIRFNHQVEAAIAESALFALLSPLRRQQFAAHASLWRCEKEEALLREGDKAEWAWTVVTGRAKIFKCSPASRQRLLIDIIGPGEICGAVYDPANASLSFSASTMEAAIVLKFPAAELRKHADSNAPLLRALLQDACLRLRHARHMHSLSIENVAGRIVCALLYLEEKFGDDIPLTRATLAELAGTTVESAIRTTKLLSDEGFLRTARRRMQITARAGLENFVDKTNR